MYLEFTIRTLTRSQAESLTNLYFCYTVKRKRFPYVKNDVYFLKPCELNPLIRKLCNTEWLQKICFPKFFKPFQIYENKSMRGIAKYHHTLLYKNQIMSIIIQLNYGKKTCILVAIYIT